MTFITIIQELQIKLKNNTNLIKYMLQDSPAIAYSNINAMCTYVGKNYNISILLNFPSKEMIYRLDSYGTQNISIIIDKTKKKFSIDSSIIKSHATKLLNAKVKDAYMYEGKEGLKVFVSDGRIDILPHSLHLWCKLTYDILKFSDWLFVNAYNYKVNHC